MESATAGSTIRIFSYSSATGSIAVRHARRRPGPTAISDLVVAIGFGQHRRATSGLSWVSFSITTILRP
jgi:hypothetical protein